MINNIFDAEIIKDRGLINLAQPITTSLVIESHQGFC